MEAPDVAVETAAAALEDLSLKTAERGSPKALNKSGKSLNS